MQDLNELGHFDFQEVNESFANGENNDYFIKVHEKIKSFTEKKKLWKR
jgi:hypothetical protein